MKPLDEMDGAISSSRRFLSSARLPRLSFDTGIWDTGNGPKNLCLHSLAILPFSKFLTANRRQ